jgi:hypothetical protein
MKIISIIIIGTVLAICRADEIKPKAVEKYTSYVLKTTTGETYRDYAILSATDTTVKISHVTGAAEIKLSDLTPESLKLIQPKLDELKKIVEVEKQKEATKEPEKAKPAVSDRPRLAKAALAGTKEGCEAYNR